MGKVDIGIYCCVTADIWPNITEMFMGQLSIFHMNFVRKRTAKPLTNTHLWNNLLQAPSIRKAVVEYSGEIQGPLTSCYVILR